MTRPEVDVDYTRLVVALEYTQDDVRYVSDVSVSLLFIGFLCKDVTIIYVTLMQDDA